MSKRLFAAVLALFLLATAALFVYAAPDEPPDSGAGSDPSGTTTESRGSGDQPDSGDTTPPTSDSASDSDPGSTPATTDPSPVTDPTPDTTPSVPDPQPDPPQPDTAPRVTTSAFTTAPLVWNTESDMGYSRLDPRDPSDTVFTNAPETQQPDSDSPTDTDETSAEPTSSDVASDITSDIGTANGESTAAQDRGASYTSRAVGIALLVGTVCAAAVTAGLIGYRRISDKMKKSEK